MRLFLYYAFHNFINQLRKLFKTWVLVFLVICMLFGAGIGLFAASLSNAVEERNAAGETAVVPDEENSSETEEEENLNPSDMAEFMEDQSSLSDFLGLSSVTAAQGMELIGGIIILIVLAFEALSADRNGSKIFQPADVPLLFASPMKPQSVLMFRVLTQLGTAIILSIYLLFQLPNLTVNMGLSMAAALGIIVAWGFTIAVGKLLQVLLYSVCSTKPGLKPYISRGVYGVLILIVLGFMIQIFSTGNSVSQGGVAENGIRGYLGAAVSYFCAPWTRLIPLWGWLKGYLYYAAAGNYGRMGLFLALNLLSIAGLVFWIHHLKVDFYEDAMAKSEETAALLEKAQSEANGGLVVLRRKKDRSDKLKRDGLNHGKGASVFFYKTLYNRLRFAHLGILSKTADTYLVAAILTAVFCRYALEVKSLIPAAIVMAIISFFRSLGNPLEQDTKMSYFSLVPAKTYTKLFYSLMGGTVTCLLDLLPGILIATILMEASPLEALGWALVIVSVDLYATLVGAFIDLSVPIAAGKTIKQVVQIMFIYFGLLPDIAVVAMGLALATPAVAVVSVIGVNLILSGVFFILSAVAIDHAFGK